MKAWIALAPLCLLGCATAGKPHVDPTAKEIAPDTSRIMAVFGRFASAHACPVSATRVLTNAHVMDVDPFNENAPYQYQRWSDEDGHSGWLGPGWVIDGNDLAVMKPDHALSKWYELAAEAPKPGDHVWFVNYSWDGTDEAYAPEVVKAEVVRVVAGHVIYKPAGKSGSSGSCVLNVDGKLVAINAWGKTVGPMGLKEVGIGVGVWGDVLPMALKEPD